jgi:hypothetical protein
MRQRGFLRRLARDFGAPAPVPVPSQGAGSADGRSACAVSSVAGAIPQEHFGRDFRRGGGTPVHFRALE